ncbi:MAG: exo-alpha-sialidase [Planctomycetes bacterium]|nr:exo-alpha-sialidase [Planctomycetota bacterium]
MPGKSILVTTILLSISVPASVLAQDTDVSGASRAVQEKAEIVQTRGRDAQVEYRALTKFGPWDDHNYAVTRADLALLPPSDQYLPDVPVFFKVFLRKEQPELGDYYPRSAAQYFRIVHGGLTVNNRLYREGLGIGYHPDPADVTASRASSRAAANEAILQLNVRGNEVAIECNPTNRLECVAGSNTTAGQTMYWSDDGGATWNFSQTNASSCCDPTIDWSSDGSRVYQADLSSTIGVRWAVSTDSGQTWGAMQVLTTSGSDKEFIHVDRSPTSPKQDNIYLTYHNSNTMQFARSTDQGATFQTPISFTAESRGIGSDITTDPAGNIYYFYPATGGQGIRLLTSTDGGATFGTGTQVAALNGRFDFPIPAMESREAFIYVSADVDANTGDIYVAWTDEADDSTGNGTGSAANNHAWIQVAKSTDQGATWTILPHPHDTSDTVSSSPVDRFHPWLKVGEDGVVHIAYYDTRNSTNRTGVDFYYTRSTNGGGCWESEQRFSTATSPNLTDSQEWGDYNALSVVMDTVVLGWTDNRTANDPTSGDDKVAMAGRDDGVSGDCPTPALPWLSILTD